VNYEAIRKWCPKFGQRMGLHIGRILPGKESFVYHSHHHEEEFVYILQQPQN
jgi:uncharacterized cupin superfamily protein